MAEVAELFEKVNEYQKTHQPEVDMETEGLGRLPEYIPSVGSVLLFNSGENPYQKVRRVKEVEKEVVGALIVTVYARAVYVVGQFIGHGLRRRRGKAEGAG